MGPPVGRDIVVSGGAVELIVLDSSSEDDDSSSSSSSGSSGASAAESPSPDARLRASWVVDSVDDVPDNCSLRKYETKAGEVYWFAVRAPGGAGNTCRRTWGGKTARTEAAAQQECREFLM